MAQLVLTVTQEQAEPVLLDSGNAGGNAFGSGTSRSAAGGRPVKTPLVATQQAVTAQVQVATAQPVDRFWLR